MSVEILPLEGLPEIREGDDLAALLAPLLGHARDGDVVAVTQKIVSKAEGRVVSDEGEGRSAWVARETQRVVARRDDLVIAETRHGFICANAGVDASNVAPGFLTLLPEDPDASAERIRAGLRERTGRDLAVVITDTFGRAWREGVVNVAIGCAGLASLVDLRGTTDHVGRELEATVVALADEVAAARVACRELQLATCPRHGLEHGDVETASTARRRHLGTDKPGADDHDAESLGRQSPSELTPARKGPELGRARCASMHHSSNAA